MVRWIVHHRERVGLPVLFWLMRGGIELEHPQSVYVRVRIDNAQASWQFFDWYMAHGRELTPVQIRIGAGSA
jgi:hypothetical protein